MTTFVPQRVACLQPSATVTLAELGLLERVVACTRWCHEVCPAVETAGCAIISDSWMANADEILAARPDLVIASVPYQEKALAEILKSGARFVALAPKCLDDIYGDIATLARIMDVADAGTRLITRMQLEIEAIRGLVQGQSSSPRPRIFCEEWGKPLIASQRWVAELVEAAGGAFVGQPGARTEADIVRDADPDAIAMAWCGAGDRVPLEKVLEQRGWENLRAAREQRVYCIPDAWLNTPAHTLLKGLRALAAIAHPEIFPAPVGMHRLEPHGQRSTVAASRV